MNLKECLMTKLIEDFERVIEDTPVSLSREDIRKAFQKAMAFFRDASEVHKKAAEWIEWRCAQGVKH